MKLYGWPTLSEALTVDLDALHDTDTILLLRCAEVMQIELLRQRSEQ